MTRDPIERETDVAIVGGGPVGLCLALALGARGVACHVLERRPDDRATFPTANHMGIQTMEHLRRHGLADEVRSAYRPDLPAEGKGHFFALTHLGGHEVARVDHALAGPGSPFVSPESEVWAPKPFFDPILLSAARAHECVTIEFGAQVESVFEDGQGPVCEIRSGPEGTRSTRLRARYVVACDGGSSGIRNALGIEQVGPPPLPIRIPSAYFRSKRVADLVPDGGVQYQILGSAAGPTPTPMGAGLMIAVDGRTLWRLHGVGLDAEDVGVTLARLRELGIDDAEIIEMAAWTPRQGIASKYRSGAIFLAGDAAKVATPYGGLSVNVGMGDAFDLAWKIDATLRGWGGSALLASSYEIERRIAGRALLEYQGVDFSTAVPTSTRPLPFFEVPTESLWQDGPDGDAARRAYGEGMLASRSDEYDKPLVDLGTDYDGSPIIVGDGSAAPDRSDVRVYHPSSRPGGRAPHVPITSDRSTIDLFGDGFTLVRTDEGVDVQRLVTAARDRQVPLRVETHAVASDAYDRALTLVRPDGYVAWRGDRAPAAPDAMLDVVRGA